MKASIASSIVGLLVFHSFAGAPVAGSQSQTRAATVQTDAAAADAWPDAKALEERRQSAENRRLFGSAEPLAITLTADFKAVQRDRDPKSVKTFPATIEFANDDGTTASLSLQVRTRGHSRRLRQTCDFAPLRLEFPKEQARKTVFDGHGPLKLGTHCRSVNEFEQYVLREYTTYRMYNLLTPRSFRARLVKATYVDAVTKKTVASRHAMFIEDDDDVAKRMEGRIADRMGLLFRNVDSETVTLMTLFAYMIGNTDMSLNKQHNVRLVQTPANAFFPVPYDFDYAGLVDAAYAVADTKQLGIATVRDRLYRGPCLTAPQFEPFFARMRAVKPDVMALFDALPDMNPSYRRDAKGYLDQFYRTIDRPGDIKRAFIDFCDNRRGM